MVLPLSIPSPDYVWQAFNLGQWLRDIGLSWVTLNINIYTFVVLVLIGIVVAMLVTGRRLRRRGAEPGIVIDISIWVIVFSIIGARLGQVALNPTLYFGPSHNPLSFLFIWEDGKLSVYGAIILGAVGALIGCKITGVRFWSFLDAAVPGVLAAQAIGRLGNWFTHEQFGAPTNLPWGLQIETANPGRPLGLPDNTLFQPTFLYEILWNLIGIVVILFIERRFHLESKRIGNLSIPMPVAGDYRLQWGRVFALYLIWYGIGRAWIESLRVDPSQVLLGVRINVWISLAAILAGLVILVVQGRRHPGLEPSVYRPGREWEPPAEVHSEDTYSDTDDDNDAVITPKVSRRKAVSGSVTSGAGTK